MVTREMVDRERERIRASGKWDRRYLGLAAHVASWSRDPSTKVGAVIVRPDKTIASLGFNGFPRGVDDDPARYEDRPTKYAMVVHAEVNAILNAREPLEGHTLYVHPLFPCGECAKAIVQSGIARVVSQPQQDEGSIDGALRWRDSNEVALTMFREAGVELG